MTIDTDVVASLRLVLGDQPAVGAQPILSDDQIWLLYTNSVPANNMNIAARDGWDAKAAIYADLMDDDESGSARKYSQLYKNAVSQRAYWTTRVNADLVNAAGANRGVGRSVAPWRRTLRHVHPTVNPGIDGGSP